MNDAGNKIQREEIFETAKKLVKLYCPGVTTKQFAKTYKTIVSEIDPDDPSKGDLRISRFIEELICASIKRYSMGCKIRSAVGLENSTYKAYIQETSGVYSLEFNDHYYNNWEKWLKFDKYGSKPVLVEDIDFYEYDTALNFVEDGTLPENAKEINIENWLELEWIEPLINSIPCEIAYKDGVYFHKPHHILKIYGME